MAPADKIPEIDCGQENLQFRALPVPLLVLHPDLRIKLASDAFYQAFSIRPSEAEGRLIHELDQGDWNIPPLRGFLKTAGDGNGVSQNFTLTHFFPRLGRRTLLLQMRHLGATATSAATILLVFEDITARQDAALRAELTLTVPEIGTWTWDIEYNQVVADRNVQRLFGIEPTDAASAPIADYLRAIHPADEPRVRALIAEAQTSKDGNFQTDYRLVQKDGSARWVTARGRIERDSAGKSVRFPGVIIDITERKKNEALQQESQGNFLQLIQSAPFGLYIIDSTFALRQVSAGAQNAFRNVRPLLGRDFAEVMRILWPEAAASKIIARFRHTLATGEPYLAPPLTQVRADVGAVESYDWKIERLKLPDGTWGVVCYFYDITESKRREDSLRESEERLRELLDNLPQLAWIIDVNTKGEARWFNKTWLTYTGATLAEMQGTGWHKAQHPDHARRVIEKFERHAQEGRDWEDTFPLRKADGEYRWFLSRMIVIRNAAGEVERLFGTNTDITDQRAASEAMALAKEKIEAASRAKDDFLAALSHELRTPLTPVLLAAAALREDSKLPSEVRDQLGMIERNIALEARLIDDLLDLTAITRGKLQLRTEVSDAHSLIGLALEIVRAEAAAKAITFERRFLARRNGLKVDPARFQQVIWNLLRNAVKFTPRGGHVTISTSEEQGENGETWIQIKVTDTGIGMDPSILGNIFQPFDQGGLTGDHRYGGLGLGLAIARAVVELHGGRIKAESAGLNQGSTFVVEFPGAMIPDSGVNDSLPLFGPKAVPRPAELAPERGPPLRLLLVDDHESTLQTLAGLLRRERYVVLTADSVAAALAIAASEKIDLVVSDLGLPDGSGNELMEKLRAQYGLRGIALSGYGMEEDLARSRSAGFITHLVKPVRVADLRTAILALTPGPQKIS